MTNIGKINTDQKDVWTEVLNSIADILGPDTVAMWLSELKVDATANRVVLTARDSFREDIIRRRLVPYIEEALRKQGVDGIVEVTNIASTVENTCMSHTDDSEFVDSVMKILRDYKLLGHVQFHETDYVLVTSSHGEIEYVSIFEVDSTTDEIDDYSFAIVEEDTIVEVLKAFGRKCMLEDSGGV